MHASTYVAAVRGIGNRGKMYEEVEYEAYERQKLRYEPKLRAYDQVIFKSIIFGAGPDQLAAIQSVQSPY